MAFVILPGGHNTPPPAHRMIDNPPVDPVRVVVLIVAVAFFAWVVWLFFWR